ncbi:hypothetical protein HK405_006338 [Cladochytrium tenue]|nr:hypothetical protein HK405_006338 [Cladochytrium tenue]
MPVNNTVLRPGQPQTNYPAGSVVIYEGVEYSVIQPHVSQVGWQPPATPALWVRVNKPVLHTGPGPQQVFAQPPPPQPGYMAGQPPSQPPPPQVEQHHGPTPAQIIGGVLAGAAVIGVGAFAIHKFSQHHSEDQKREQWVAAVTAQTQQEYNAGSPAFWVLTEGNNVPPNAIQIGTDGDGSPLFAGRAYHENGIQIGKVGHKFGMYIPYGGREVPVHRYQVLCGNPNAIRSVNSQGFANLQALGCRVVEGGHESDGTPLYVAVADVPGRGSQPGKAGPKINGANYPWGGKEHTSPAYRLIAL